jgi:hypothetical protein
MGYRKREDRGTNHAARATVRTPGAGEDACQEARRSRGRAPGGTGYGSAAGDRAADQQPLVIPGVAGHEEAPTPEDCRVRRGSCVTTCSRPGAVVLPLVLLLPSEQEEAPDTMGEGCTGALVANCTRPGAGYLPRVLLGLAFVLDREPLADRASRRRQMMQLRAV